jgi:hypothetical protein
MNLSQFIRFDRMQKSALLNKIIAWEKKNTWKEERYQAE